MNPEAICNRLDNVGEDICQLRAAVGQTPDGLAARLANLQDSISILHQDVARQIPAS